MSAPNWYWPAHRHRYGPARVYPGEPGKWRVCACGMFHHVLPPGWTSERARLFYERRWGVKKGSWGTWVR